MYLRILAVPREEIKLTLSHVNLKAEKCRGEADFKHGSLH